GSTDKLGDEFTYRYKDLHYSKQKVSESIPGEKVVWHVLDADLSFTQKRTEWIGTDIIFEISRKGDATEVRFTHAGLVPSFQCFDDCAGGWSFYINDSLRNFIIFKRTPNSYGKN
ncbi:MAG: hypothetical protein JWO73_959, partial [Candidatus Taylorbacteria bacterium]|nr:hypothetical protein [Candidatus Taylorbacteria bacterium]